MPSAVLSGARFSLNRKTSTRAAKHQSTFHVRHPARTRWRQHPDAAAHVAKRWPRRPPPQPGVYPVNPFRRHSIAAAAPSAPTPRRDTSTAERDPVRAAQRLQRMRGSQRARQPAAQVCLGGDTISIVTYSIIEHQQASVGAVRYIQRRDTLRTLAHVCVQARWHCPDFAGAVYCYESANAGRVCTLPRFGPERFSLSV